MGVGWFGGERYMNEPRPGGWALYNNNIIRSGPHFCFWGRECTCYSMGIREDQFNPRAMGSLRLCGSLCPLDSDGRRCTALLGRDLPQRAPHSHVRGRGFPELRDHSLTLAHPASWRPLWTSHAYTIAAHHSHTHSVYKPFQSRYQASNLTPTSLVSYPNIDIIPNGLA